MQTKCDKIRSKALGCGNRGLWRFPWIVQSTARQTTNRELKTMQMAENLRSGGRKPAPNKVEMSPPLIGHQNASANYSSHLQINSCWQIRIFSDTNILAEGFLRMCFCMISHRILSAFWVAICGLLHGLEGKIILVPGAEKKLRKFIGIRHTAYATCLVWWSKQSLPDKCALFKSWHTPPQREGTSLGGNSADCKERWKTGPPSNPSLHEDTSCVASSSVAWSSVLVAKNRLTHVRFPGH